MQETQEVPQSLGWQDPLEEEMQPAPVFLPEKFHGQRSLVGCSPWGHKESNMTEQLSTHSTDYKVRKKKFLFFLNSHNLK